MSFERSLLADRTSLGAAASFYVKLKHGSMGYEPPDETGQLEGQFTVPVPQALELMSTMVENEFKTMYAYKTYANSLRGLSHHSIADEFEDHAENEIEHADFLLRRMAVLGGAVHVPDIPAPPADTDPVAIIQTMVRMEQEGIAKWKALHAITGDNPMKFKIEEYLTREQEHLDELWQMLPHEARDMGVPMAPTGQAQDQAGMAPEGAAKQAEFEEIKKKLAWGFTGGRVGGMGGSVTSAFRPAAKPIAGTTASMVGNLSKNVSTPFGPQSHMPTVQNLLGQMKTMGQPAAPVDMAGTAAKMQQGTLRGAVNQAGQAVGGAVDKAKGFFSGLGQKLQGMTATGRMQQEMAKSPAIERFRDAVRGTQGGMTAVQAVTRRPAPSIGDAARALPRMTIVPGPAAKMAAAIFFEVMQKHAVSHALVKNVVENVESVPRLMQSAAKMKARAHGPGESGAADMLFPKLKSRIADLAISGHPSTPPGMREELRGLLDKGHSMGGIKNAASEHIEKAHTRAEGNLAARSKTHEGQRGELYGDLVGRLAGGAGGAFAGKKGGPIAQVAAAALGQHLGGKGGKLIGKELDVRREKAKHAGVKFAFEDTLNMLAQEQAAEAAAVENQARYFQEKARSEQQAREQLEQQAQQAQQQLEELQAQHEQLQQGMQATLQQANDSTTQALMQAVQSTQDAIRHKQTAADTLVTHENLRQTLRDLADGGGTPGGPTNPQNANPGEGQGQPAQGPAMEGPAGQAQGAQSAPGAAPPEGAQGPGGGNAPAESPQQGQAAPASNVDQGPPGGGEGGPGKVSIKVGNVVQGLMQIAKQRAPYALAGALAGGATHEVLKGGGPDETRQAIQAAEASGAAQDSFRAALDLARLKTQLAFREAAEAHPGASLGMSALAGGALGAVRGPEVHKNIKDIGKNISFLAG